MKFDFLTMMLNRAELYTDAKYAVTKARGKVQELKNLKNKLESETQRQMAMTLHRKESTAIQSNENLNGECSFTLQLFYFLSLSLSHKHQNTHTSLSYVFHINTTNCKVSPYINIRFRIRRSSFLTKFIHNVAVMAEPIRETEPRQNNEMIITNEYQTSNVRQEMVTSLGVASQLSRQSATNPVSHLQGSSQEQQNAREQAPIVGQEVAPDAQCSNQHNKKQGSIIPFRHTAPTLDGPCLELLQN